MLSTASTTRQTYDDDPLTLAMRPPPNETEDERGRRLQLEEDAKRVSDVIDEELRQEKMARRRLSRRVTKILLLGASRQRRRARPFLTSPVSQARQRAARARP